MEEKINRFISESSHNLNLGDVRRVEEIEHRVYSQKKRFVVDTSKGRFFFKFYENGFATDYVPFLDFLTSKEFPAQRLATNQPLLSPHGYPVLVYHFLSGEMRPFLEETELKGVSQLVARLHSESDAFYGLEQPQNRGLTHGDLKLQNLLFVDNQPHLIDFEKMKVRDYISDVASFLFFGTLSDIYQKYTSNAESEKRAKIFIKSYEDYRKVKLEREQLTEHISKKRAWFVRWVDKQLGRGLHRDKELWGKIKLVDIVCEVIT